jgi:hypothetical protein
MSQIDEVTKLRRELEDANWKLPIERLQKLTERHREILKERTVSCGPVFYKGIKILSSFTRICVGAHGPYIEFTRKHLEVPIKVKEGQEWRTSPKYQYVKYEWWTPTEIPELKLYLQKHGVKYADYRPGYYYMDLYLADSI